MWLPGKFQAIGLHKLIAASLASTCFLWIGTGIGLLFQRWQAGATIGAILQTLLLMSWAEIQ